MLRLATSTNCGISVTIPGTNMVPSTTVMSTFLPGNSSLASAQPTIEQNSSVVATETTARNTELTKYRVMSNSKNQARKLSSVGACGHQVMGRRMISALVLNAPRIIQTNGSSVPARPTDRTASRAIRPGVSRRRRRRTTGAIGTAVVAGARGVEVLTVMSAAGRTGTG